VPIPSSGRILALDWGERRFGLAVSDETQLIASPLVTLTRRPGKRFPMPALLDQIGRTEPVGIVVGLPLESSGVEGSKAAEVRALAERIRERSGLPVELADERMSTARALAAIGEQGGTTRNRKAEVDALAAAVILQQFLDTRRGER
jgi:putative Holliday junction resolvase